MDAEKVAKGIDRAHKEIPILTYNDENSLSGTIQLAFYFAREYYAVVRELPAGITYDRDSKQHTYVIEKMIKE